MLFYNCIVAAPLCSWFNTTASLQGRNHACCIWSRHNTGLDYSFTPLNNKWSLCRVPVGGSGGGRGRLVGFICGVRNTCNPLPWNSRRPKGQLFSCSNVIKRKLYEKESRHTADSKVGELNSVQYIHLTSYLDIVQLAGCLAPGW